jgi:thymidylate synthase
MFEMLPYGHREIDYQYWKLLTNVLEFGIQVPSPTGVDTISLPLPETVVFDLCEGVPLITERNLNPKTVKNFPQWQQAIGEIIGFIHGARTQKELENFGCYWWYLWVTPEKCAKRGLEPGDLGLGSYGPAFHDFPTSEGSTHNQIQAVLDQMVYKPYLKTHVVSPFVPQYIMRGEGIQQKTVVVPCHGLMHFRIIGSQLQLYMWQRSGDLVLGVPNNWMQYSALLLMVNSYFSKRGLDFDELIFVHTISDAHIYVNQLSAVEIMVERKQRQFPTLQLDPDVGFWETRVKHFSLSDYYPWPGIKGIAAAI